MQTHRNMPFALLAGLLTAAMLGLSGCAGVVIGAGAAVGVAAMQERGVEEAARDLGIEAEIGEKWLRKDHKMFVALGVESYEGRVLLTGIAPTEEIRAEAVDLAWKVEGVKEVYNEIVVSESSDLIDSANDSWISTQLRSKITFDKKILAINYHIDTVNGTIYLLGIAQNRKELERVIAHAKNITYVRGIVDHVRVKTPT